MDLKVLYKSQKFLIQVMGQEAFDKFIEDGKIEIKHIIEDNEIIYELNHNAKVYNKTTNQFYCILPICPDDLPIHDQIAIKYSYLKNNIKRVEEVANKTTIEIDDWNNCNLGNIQHFVQENHHLRTELNNSIHRLNRTENVSIQNSLSGNRQITINVSSGVPPYTFKFYVNDIEDITKRITQDNPFYSFIYPVNVGYSYKATVTDSCERTCQT